MLWINRLCGLVSANCISPLMELGASEAFRLVHYMGNVSPTSSDYPFDTVENCPTEALEGKSVASDLDGTLLLSRSSFPYFMLVAFEAGGPLRAIVLLLLSPIAWFLYNLVSEELGIKLLIFISTAGIKLSALEAVSRGVLPKFYLEDMHPLSYKIFTSCTRRIVVTANPRVMVEPFLKDYLGVEAVLGTELQVTSGGYCTGIVCYPGVLVGENKERAVKKYFGDDFPDIGLGDRETDFPFMSQCKEAYLVPKNTKLRPVPKTQYLKPLIFHDGRLVCRPTPYMSLVVLLWAPIGFCLAVLRIASGLAFPVWVSIPVGNFLGTRLFIRGTPPVSRDGAIRKGVLFVCTHRTLLDPIFLSVAVRNDLTAVTYSISRISEILSPIKTQRLSRCRVTDAATMSRLLEEGNLVVCPEGTTCREPFLLRFSALFAELADQIVPVSMNCKMQLFHGTTARGWKGLDPLFFFMNPTPEYEVTFLPQLPVEMTCTGGKTPHEVANYIQRLLANSLGFQCTNYTRKDKYRILAGNDGIVSDGSDVKPANCTNK
ncbi:hypothetical protein R1sor_014667 [Riccia sorocarpa]|uniref:Phospholipid/glycerol acyltransferase domain-containing protein n=1 Tax=Riccia sorocarpa TaxID=122646 RepID=A0ABD3HAJ6_9MARC